MKRFWLPFYMYSTHAINCMLCFRDVFIGRRNLQVKKPRVHTNLDPNFYSRRCTWLDTRRAPCAPRLTATRRVQMTDNETAEPRIHFSRIINRMMSHSSLDASPKAASTHARLLQHGVAVVCCCRMMCGTQGPLPMPQHKIEPLLVTTITRLIGKNG